MRAMGVSRLHYVTPSDLADEFDRQAEARFPVPSHQGLAASLTGGIARRIVARRLAAGYRDDALRLSRRRSAHHCMFVIQGGDLPRLVTEALRRGLEPHLGPALQRELVAAEHVGIADHALPQLDISVVNAVNAVLTRTQREQGFLLNNLPGMSEYGSAYATSRNLKQAGDEDELKDFHRTSVPPTFRAGKTQSWAAFTLYAFELHNLRTREILEIIEVSDEPQTEAEARLLLGLRNNDIEEFRMALALATHPQTQAGAHLELGRRGADDPMEHLREALRLATDPQAQAEAHLLLGLRGADDPMEHLREALRLATDPLTQAAAHLALGLRGADDPMEHLREALRLATRPGTQAGAHLALGLCGADDPVEHLREALRLATDPQTQAKAHFGLGLCGADDPREHFQEALRLATDPLSREKASMQIQRLDMAALACDPDTARQRAGIKRSRSTNSAEPAAKRTRPDGPSGSNHPGVKRNRSSDDDGPAVKRERLDSPT